MFTDNPFAALSASISPAIMQAYVLSMILFVVVGTLYDISHKKSGRYFFHDWKRTTGDRAERAVGSGEMALLAIRTIGGEVLTSREVCNTRRRIAHLLTMYGFLVYAITTIVMVFWYPTAANATPALLPQLWDV